jgi:hypothetical protein
MIRPVSYHHAMPEPDDLDDDEWIEEESGVRKWIAPAALVIALVGTGLAAWSLLRPTPGPQIVAVATPAATAEQSADAKVKVCNAFNTVRTAVQLQTHSDPGSDPIAQQAVAANARLSILGGGSYLLAQLDPATPSDLADAARSFAGTLQAIAMNTLAGVPNDEPTQAARLRDGETDSNKVADLCK